MNMQQAIKFMDDTIEALDEHNVHAATIFAKNARKSLDSQIMWADMPALPNPHILCWIRRKSGMLFIGYRNAEPIPTHDDRSIDRHWSGRNINYPIDAVNINKFNFSDMTVDAWSYVMP